MKPVSTAIVTLIALLAMLAGEPARVLAGLAAVSTEQRTLQADCCGDDGTCCCGDQQGCDDEQDLQGRQGSERDRCPCPCSPGPARSLTSLPTVAAMLESRGVAGVRQIDVDVPASVPVGAVTLARLVGAGRAWAWTSTGDRLAWWCVRQV